MVPLNYNQLYYFFKIAQLGSISQASKSILISSPALSMQLKELEATLKTRLFSRVGKKLVLTEAGAIVYEYAKDIFKLGYELRDTLGDRGQGMERLRIEIGCQDSIPKFVSAQLLSFLLQKKNCKVLFREGSHDQLVSMQDEFKLDLILTTSLPSSLSNSIYESKSLIREELIAVAHPKFKTLKTKWPKSLAGAPVILPTFDAISRQRLDQYFKERQLTVDVVAEVEDKAIELDLAIKGLGIASTMKSCVQQFLKNKQLIQVGTFEGLHEEVWMVIGKRKILNPLALNLMKNFSFP